MSEGDEGREILSLLEHYSLKTQIELYKSWSGDFDGLVHVLLSAYIETTDSVFYGLFYRETFPSLLEHATSTLNRVKTPTEPEDLVAEAHIIFLNICMKDQLEQIVNPFRYLLQIIKNLAYSSWTESQRKRLYALKENEHVSPCNRPLDKLIMREEDKRKENQKVLILELLLGKQEGLTNNHRDVFHDFYINNLSVKDIAHKRHTTADNVYKIINRTKKRIRRLTESLISLEKREDRP